MSLFYECVWNSMLIIWLYSCIDGKTVHVTCFIENTSSHSILIMLINFCIRRRLYADRMIVYVGDHYKPFGKRINIAMEFVWHS